MSNTHILRARILTNSQIQPNATCNPAAADGIMGADDWLWPEVIRFNIAGVGIGHAS